MSYTLSNDIVKILKQTRVKALIACIVKCVTTNNTTTAERPTTNLVIGQQVFDTTLNQPIWYTGTEWVNAAGAAV